MVLADVPLDRNFLQKVFPSSATLAEESYDFEVPGPQQPERAHSSPKPPFCNPAFLFLPNLFLAWPPLHSLAVKKLIFVQILGGEKLLEKCR